MSYRRIFLICLAILLVLGLVGYRWIGKIEPVSMTAADLDSGGNFSVEEKSALTAACSARVKKDADRSCSCITDKAATDLSRFERLFMTASFEGRPLKMIGVARGLVEAGVPKGKIDAAINGSKERISGLMKLCGFAE